MFVFGRVQGVYYRDFTSRHAVRLGLKGFVRNLRDRSVEVHAEGTRDNLEKLLGLLKQGPPGARVENVKYEWLEKTGSYSDFRVTG